MSKVKSIIRLNGLSLSDQNLRDLGGKSGVGSYIQCSCIVQSSIYQSVDDVKNAIYPILHQNNMLATRGYDSKLKVEKDENYMPTIEQFQIILNSQHPITQNTSNYYQYNQNDFLSENGSESTIDNTIQTLIRQPNNRESNNYGNFMSQGNDISQIMHYSHSEQQQINNENEIRQINQQNHQFLHQQLQANIISDQSIRKSPNESVSGHQNQSSALFTIESQFHQVNEGLDEPQNSQQNIYLDQSLQNNNVTIEDKQNHEISISSNIQTPNQQSQKNDKEVKLTNQKQLQAENQINKNNSDSIINFQNNESILNFNVDSSILKQKEHQHIQDIEKNYKLKSTEESTPTLIDNQLNNIQENWINQNQEMKEKFNKNQFESNYYQEEYNEKEEVQKIKLASNSCQMQNQTQSPLSDQQQLQSEIQIINNEYHDQNDQSQQQIQNQKRERVNNNEKRKEDDSQRQVNEQSLDQISQKDESVIFQINDSSVCHNNQNQNNENNFLTRSILGELNEQQNIDHAQMRKVDMEKEKYDVLEQQTNFQIQIRIKEVQMEKQKNQDLQRERQKDLKKIDLLETQVINLITEKSELDQTVIQLKEQIDDLQKLQSPDLLDCINQLQQLKEQKDELLYFKRETTDQQKDIIIQQQEKQLKEQQEEIMFLRQQLSQQNKIMEVLQEIKSSVNK